MGGPLSTNSIMNMWSCRFTLFVGKNLIDAVDRATQVRNRNRSPNHQRHIERVQELCSGNANGGALFDVIGNAIITAEYCRSHETEQLFGPFIERAVFVGLRIEREKTFDAEMIAAKKFLVHRSAITIEFVHYLCSCCLRCCATYRFGPSGRKILTCVDVAGKRAEGSVCQSSNY